MPHIKGHLSAADRNLKEREKRKQALIQQGLSEKASGQQFERERETGQIEIDEQRELEVKKEAAAPILKEQGAFEEVTPREISLQPRTEFGEGLPVLGRTIAVEFGILDRAIKKGWIGGLIGDLVREEAEAAVPTGAEEFPKPLTPETVREGALRQISINAFDNGISLSESFGAMVEAIPVAGGLVGKYVGGLVEAPFSNANNIIDDINKMKEAASTGQEKVRNGLEDPDYGVGRARQMEENIAKLEGRLKLLISTSAILRANTDQVNKIQEQVLEAKEKVSRYKKASSFGLTAQLTGTGRPIPTDEQIYFELRENNERR